MLRVAALTGGRETPSARFRVRQLVPALAAQGVAVRELAAAFSTYPPRSRWLRPAWGALAVADGIVRAVRARSADVTLLQREFVSTFVTAEPITPSPRVLDVDDAIFLFRDGFVARRLAMLCERVICGNAYLADWFSRVHRDVVVIPTAVDTERYSPANPSPYRAPVIGWIGTSGNLRYLDEIEGALRRTMAAHPDVRLHVVSDRPPRLHSLPGERVLFLPWSEGSEVASLQGMDIGIMPLEDSPWSRGKCSFKMLQYMACAIPVVVSPVGMNAEVLALGKCGVAASSEQEWVDGLLGLARDAALRVSLGAAGRDIAQAHFSVTAVAPQVARALGATLGTGSTG